jgi:hypothetical protein
MRWFTGTLLVAFGLFHLGILVAVLIDLIWG